MYLQNFFQEKEIKFQSWQLTDKEGQNNFIDSDVAIEFIMNSTDGLKTNFENKLRELDFYNQPIEPFLKYVAQGLVDMRQS